MVIELSLTFDLYLVLDSGSGVSISYRDSSRQPVHHSVDISLRVQYESRTGYTKDISEPQVPLFTTRALIYSGVRSFSSYSSGMSQQKMYEVLSNLVVKTLTSGRLRTLFHLFLSWSIDPDLVVEGGWGWNLSHKTLGVVLVGVA
jgi:hypothetical protein